MQIPAWRTFDQVAAETPADFHYMPGQNCAENQHHGQLKLLRAEEEFLLRHLTIFFDDEFCKAEQDVVVVYAGAAPGKHLVYLINKTFELFSFLKLFKITKFHPRRDAKLRFMLYDRVDFDTELKDLATRKRNKVALKRRFFTDQDARSWSETGERVFFISDIRSVLPDVRQHVHASSKQADDERVEKGVHADMQDQARWVLMMKPQAALLKFRPPYWYGWCSEENKQWSYLPGMILLPCWGRKHTSECRLDVDVDSMHSKQLTLDIQRYQDVMAYFNATWRPEYDSKVEQYITQLYAANRLHFLG